MIYSLHLRQELLCLFAVIKPPITHLNPQFVIENTKVFMSTADMAGVSLSACGQVVTNLEEKRSEIINALDFLVSGF